MKRLYTLFLFLFLILPIGITTAQWQMMSHSFGDEVTLLAYNNGRLFATAPHTGVFYSSDNGGSWNQIGYFNNTTTQTNIQCMTFNGDNVYAGGAGGSVYLSGDNGDSWQETPTKPSNISGGGDYIAYAGGNILVDVYGGGPVYSSDGGNTWHDPSMPSTGVGANGDFAKIGNYVYCGELNGIFRSSDNGETFSLVDSNSTPVPAYAFTGVGTNVIEGGYSGIYLSTDGGLTWQSTDFSDDRVGYLSTDGTYIFTGSIVGTGVLVSKDSGSTWTKVNSGLPLSNGGPNVEIVTSMTIAGETIFVGFPDSTVWSQSISDAVLPVELVSFSATSNSLTADLSWRTATEVNNAGFDIERQPASSPQWTKIGSVAGAGTSNSPHNYSYTDNVGTAGTYSYRLKQIDHDGAFVYSQAVQVTIAAPKVLALSQNFPEPFNPSTTIQFTVPRDGRATLKVYNTLGQEVATVFDGEAAAATYHQVQFNASNLASGIYFSRLEFSGNMQVKKMLLLK